MDIEGEGCSTNQQIRNLKEKAGTRDWRKLFATPEDQSLQFFPLEKVDGEKLWKNAVVGQFIGHMPNFSLFQRLVSIMWGSDSTVEVKPTGRNLFIIQFLSAKKRDSVLEKGPWHIQNKPLIIRKREPGMSSLDLDLTRVPVWIHLRNVPLELFTKDGLSYIANLVGTPLYMDWIIATQKRLAFAKICVELDINAEVLETIDVRMKNDTLITVHVEVPWFPQKCNHCNIFGHVTNLVSRKELAQKEQQ
ncbi:hypothetical protein DITRI_Ditri19aG0091600 [Diplodiscus trichospermus]